MPTIKITNKQIPIKQDYHEFCPRWSLEKAEYEKAVIKSVDEKPESRFKTDKQVRRAGDIGEPLDHWPRLAPTEETVYYQFIDKISSKDKFYPARDEDRRPIKNTGAVHVITDIVRLKTGDGPEFLLSKGNIIGHDAAGEEVHHYLSYPERWFKTLFSWTNEYNNSRKAFDKICLGPSGTETVYMLEFNKNNAKELFEQRANDIQINFIVKDQVSDEARMVEKDVNAQKTFERFANNSWDYLWAGEYIPIQVRAELRQEAVARGYIKGGSSDYQPPSQPTKTGKNAYG